jgi:hypothetical protein
MEVRMRGMAVLLAMTLAACATPNTGVVPIGEGKYMLSKMGGMGVWLGGEVKAGLYREASAFCVKQGKRLEPLGSSSQDATYGRYATAEIQFACV